MIERRLILFNGPPYAGKDECAKYLYSKRHGTHWFRLSQPLKDGVKATFNLTDAEQAALEAKKDQPSPILMGKTYREVQISMSEDWCKPFFGKSIFGQIALRRIQRSIAKLFVCSDSGFVEEVLPLLTHFKKEEVLLVYLHRKGRDFSNDSRSYIRLDGIKTVTLENNGSLALLHDVLDGVIDGWIEGS